MSIQLNPSEISELIKDRIKNFEADAEARTEGTIVMLTDGIARVHGLSEAMQGEMLEFPGNTYGLALNLEQDSVGAVVLGEYKHLSEGDTVKCTGRILEVPTGDAMLGRVLDSLDKSPHKDNTIVVLWSDHGWHLGEKQHWQKFTLWRAATRVPFMVRVPKHNEQL